MNQEMTKAYEAFVQQVADRIKGYANPITIVFGVLGGIVFGSWGYEAGNVGGAIFFTIGGFFTGGMIGFELPNSIVAALGTVKRLTLLMTLIGISILLTYLFNSILLGFALFIATWLYLFYLSRQSS